MLSALEHTGLSRVELKRDARDGALRLMEFNPRVWQWHGLAAACGVDLTRIAYEDLTEQRPPYVDAVFARDDLEPALVKAARLLQ